MSKAVVILSALLVFFSLSVQANADACSGKARSLAASMNASVISVQAQNDGNGGVICVAKLQVMSPGQPARIVTKKFRP